MEMGEDNLELFRLLSIIYATNYERMLFLKDSRLCQVCQVCTSHHKVNVAGKQRTPNQHTMASFTASDISVNDLIASAMTRLQKVWDEVGTDEASRTSVQNQLKINLEKV